MAMKWTRWLPAAAAMLAVSGLHAAELHVSPAGADANPGTKELPLHSLAAARKAVRSLKAGAAGPVTVLLHGGTYYLPETLVFTAEDSGTEKAPVVYAAAPGEEVVVSGGERLELTWEPYREGIRKARIRRALRPTNSLSTANGKCWPATRTMTRRPRTSTARPPTP